VIQAMLRNEGQKLLKRFGFWVALSAFAVIMGTSFGASYYGAHHGGMPFGLPGAWRDIVGGQAMVGPFFMSVVIVLLISSEFEWRTARQNIIDGLSKEQWFLAKALLVPGLTVIFLGLYLLIGIGFALPGTDFHAFNTMGARDVEMLVGIILGFLGMGTLALFVSFMVRNPGPAMAVWLFYVAVLERLVAAALVAYSEKMKPVVRWFPATIFSEFGNRLEYDPETVRKMIEQAPAMHRPPPVVWGFGPLCLIATGWIIVLVGAAYLTYRKRDL
jgi:ABC-type transport system involved in multi-copper enzyme maturation permease subunit